MPSMPSMLPTHPGSYMFLFRTGVIQRGRSLSCSRIVQGRLGRSFTRSEGRRRFRRDRAGTRGSRGRGRGRNAPGHPYEVGDKRRTRTCDRCQERPLGCVEQSEVEVLRSRSAGIAIFRYFDPCGPNMWVGTGCGGLSQASATISAPVQDARGGTTPLAEAVGARPIVDAMAATARTPASHWMMFCPVPIARHFRRVPQRGCLRGILVAMSITS
jgi:hypothetical protein